NGAVQILPCRAAAGEGDRPHRASKDARLSTGYEDGGGGGEGPMTRAILIVLDSVGCGGAEDAKAYRDEGADTLGHIAEACASGKGDRDGLRRGPLRLPRLAALGLGHAMKASTGRPPP